MMISFLRLLVTASILVSLNVPAQAIKPKTTGGSNSEDGPPAGGVPVRPAGDAAATDAAAATVALARPGGDSDAASEAAAAAGGSGADTAAQPLRDAYLTKTYCPIDALAYLQRGPAQEKNHLLIGCSLSDPAASKITPLGHVSDLYLEAAAFEGNVAECWITIARLFPNLTSLTLRGGLDQRSLAALMGDEDLQKLDQIREPLSLINLTLYMTRDDVGTTFLGLIEGKKLPSLQGLSLGGCTWVTDEVLSRLAPNLPHLQTLNLWGCSQVTEAGIFPLLNRVPALRELILLGNPPVSEGVAQDLRRLFPKLILKLEP